MLDLAILGLLFEQEMHGYEIRRRLRDELGLFANISFGSLYPALSRLERSGAVTVAGGRCGAGGADPLHRVAERGARRAPGPPGRAPASGTKRSRKVYRITDQGRALFEQLLEGEEPAGTDDARSFGLRLAFARHLAPSARLALLERRRAQLTRRLATDLARASGERLDVYTRSLVEHSTEATEHDIAWLDRLIEAERLRQAPAGRPTAPTGPDPAGSDLGDPRSGGRHDLDVPFGGVMRASTLRGAPANATPRGRDHTHEGIHTMSKIRVAIAGVGNCASSLIQGVEYYKDAVAGEVVPGLMHVDLGGYHVSDLEFVAAFDVDAAKVGTGPGQGHLLQPEQHHPVRRRAATSASRSSRGPTLDGLNSYYREMIEESPAEPVDVVASPDETGRRGPGQLPAGRVRGGAALLRAVRHRRRGGLRQRHPRVHRLRPRVGTEVPRRRGPDRGRRHQVPGRAPPSSTGS